MYNNLLHENKGLNKFLAVPKKENIKKTWDKYKWVDDPILNWYSSPMSENISKGHIALLGLSANEILTF